MTIGDFLDRLAKSKSKKTYVVDATPQPDGSILLECDHGWHDKATSVLSPPANRDDTLDEFVARKICRELLIDPSDVGL